MENASKKIILVLGYPKSGNTWVARLIAELIGCPVGGFLNEPKNPEPAIEGLERSSSYILYKGHQPYSQIGGKDENRHVIYVVRDVRDIAISGAHYFGSPKARRLTNDITRVPLVRRASFLLKPIVDRINIKEMIRTLDVGNTGIQWCSIPWDEHVIPYLQAGIFNVRYENLLSKPFNECKRILNHIGLYHDITDEDIREAINRQSFETVKKKFESLGDKQKALFLRKGFSGQWKKDLTRKQKIFLNQRFGSTLKRLGYFE